MASTHKSLRSGTANKRPTTSIADGQIALNTNTTSPGLFFKDSTGATIIKVGPVHVGTTAPNASPAAGGSAGNSVGEIWLDTSLTPVGVKIWNGSAFVNATPIGSTTVQGLLELATNAETQTGTDPDRAVTPAGLQSKVSDSTSTTSSTTIASSTAVKSAYDLANAALPKSGGTVTGNLEIGTTGSLSFEGATADAFETTIAVVDPTADRTITLPDTTGTIVTTGDTGTVTSTMIADGTIVNGDINASAAIAHSKLANITAGQVLLGNASNVPTATALAGDITVDSSGVTAISSGVIVNADVNASAAIAGTKISPDFGSQTIATTGIVSHALGTAGAPTVTFTGDTNTGIYSPGADQVAISTGGSGRLFVDASGNVGVGAAAATILDSTQSAAAAYSSWTIRNTASNGYAQQQFLVGAGGANGQATVSYAPGLFFAVGPTGNDTTTPIVFRNNNSQERLRITSTGALNFVGAGTAGSTQAVSFNGSAPINSLVIDSSGRLGVGTSSPVNLLQVRQTTSASVPSAGSSGHHFAVGDTAFGLAAGGLSSGNAYLQATRWDGTAANYNLLLNPNGGNVGIGTSSPNAILDLTATAGAGGQTSVIRFGLGATAESWIGVANSAGNVIANSAQGDTVIRNDGGKILLSTDSGTTAHAVIDSSGRVGIGTTPDSRLHVSDASGNALRIGYTSGGNFNIYDANIHSFRSSNATTDYGRFDASGRLLVGTSSTATAGNSQYSLLQVKGGSGLTSAVLSLTRAQAAASISSGSGIGSIAFGDEVGNPYAYIACESDAASGAGDYPGRLVFSTTADGASSPTERMRIGNDGFVYFHTTSTFPGAGNTNLGAMLERAGTNGTSLFVSRSDNVPLFLNRNSDGGLLNCNRSGTTVGGITVTTTATAFNTSSDYRLKENVTPVTDGIARLQQLKPSRFNFIADPAKTVDGFLAHEAAEVVPECVTGEKDAVDDDGNPVYQGIDQSKLVPLLTAALQEAIGRIETLEAEVAALKAQ